MTREHGRFERYLQSFQTAASLKLRGELKTVQLRNRATLLLRQAFVEAWHLYEEDTPYGDPSTFLQWLLDHWEEILAIVLRLLPLFA